MAIEWSVATQVTVAALLEMLVEAIFDDDDVKAEDAIEAIEITLREEVARRGRDT